MMRSSSMSDVRAGSDLVLAAGLVSGLLSAGGAAGTPGPRNEFRVGREPRPAGLGVAVEGATDRAGAGAWLPCAAGRWAGVACAGAAYPGPTGIEAEPSGRSSSRRALAEL